MLIHDETKAFQAFLFFFNCIKYLPIFSLFISMLYFIICMRVSKCMLFVYFKCAYIEPIIFSNNNFCNYYNDLQGDSDYPCQFLFRHRKIIYLSKPI